MKPLLVYKDNGLWRWACQLHPCARSDRRDRHRNALADGLVHIARHADFGFQGHPNRPENPRTLRKNGQKKGPGLKI